MKDKVEKNGRLASLISKRFEKVVAENSLYVDFLRHSDGYMSAFGVTRKDLPHIRRTHEGSRDDSIATIRILGDEKMGTFWYEFCVWHVCGIPYGGSWSDAIVCWCTMANVNISAGGGTTRITVVPEAHHRRIMEAFAGRRPLYIHEEGESA